MGYRPTDEQLAQSQDRIKGLTADELAQQARIDFSYGEVKSVHSDVEGAIYWMSRAATLAGLAAYEARTETGDGETPQISVPVAEAEPPAPTA